MSVFQYPPDVPESVVVRFHMCGAHIEQNDERCHTCWQAIHAHEVLALHVETKDLLGLNVEPVEMMRQGEPTSMPFHAGDDFLSELREAVKNE